MTSPDNLSMEQYKRAMQSTVGEWDIDDDVRGGLLSRIPFVGHIISAIQGLVTNGPLAGLAQLVGLRWAQVDNHQAGFANLFDGWFGGGGTGDAGQVTEVISSIKSAIYGDTTVYTLTGSGDFTIPQCSSLIVACLNGGGGGGAGAGMSGAGLGPGGAGGVDGGYNAIILDVADIGGVGASVAYSCGLAGAGGSGNAQAGGQGTTTTFGPSGNPFHSGQPGIGSMPGDNRAGYSPTTSQPGAGGQGGGSNGASTSGLSSATAAGGTRGTSTGAAGQAGKPHKPGPIPSGGGGGGGGAAGSGASFSPAGAGAPGGNYGAGGGGGGSAGNYSPYGAGANGCPGAIYILIKE